MLSKEISDKWHGHITVPKSKIIDIHIPHHVDLQLLPDNWDLRKKKANCHSINIPKDVTVDCVPPNSCNFNNTEEPTPLYKSFDKSLLHELYMNMPIVPHKPQAAVVPTTKSECRLTLFGNLPSDVIITNKLHTELLQNNQQIYVSPFLIEHGNSMYDHLYQYNNQSTVDVIELPCLKSLLVEFFFSVFSGNKLPVAKFRISGTSTQSTSKLMQFVHSISDLLLPLIQNSLNSQDLFLAIVASEIKLFIDSFIIILCNPLLPTFPTSKLPQNPYFSIFANSSDLYHSSSISSILNWLYQFHYLCHSLSFLVSQLSSASSITAISSISINHPFLSPLLDKIKFKFHNDLQLYIFNQIPLSCQLLESDLDLINHHLNLPIYASNINELQELINNYRIHKYNAQVESELLHELAKKELFERMMIKQPFKDIQPIQLPKVKGQLPVIRKEPDVLEQMTNEEKKLLEWRIKRLKRFKQTEEVEEVEEMQEIQEQVDEMQIDKVEPPTDTNSIVYDDLATFELNPMLSCQLLTININGSINTFDIIMIRDISCVVSDLINNDIFSVILQLFRISPFLIKESIHMDVIIIPNGIIHVNDDTCCCKLDFTMIWFPLDKLVPLFDKYFTSLLNLYISLESANMTNRLRLKTLESEFFLGIEIGLRPLVALLDTRALFGFDTWELDLKQLASSLIIRVATVSINKMHKIMDTRDLDGFDDIPKAMFGTTKWYSAWELWIDMNDVDNIY